MTLVLPAGVDAPRARRSAALLPAARYRVTIEAHDIVTPISTISADAADAATLEIGNVPPGVARLITLDALTASDSPIPGATWRAVATIAASRTRVVLSASSTAVGRVWARWLASGKQAFAAAQSPSEVARKLDAIKIAGRLPHHAFVAADKFADAAVAAGSLDVGTSGFAIAPAAVSLTLSGAPGRVSADVWVDDPASPLQTGLSPLISQSAGRYTLAPILPGDWTVNASVPGMGVVSKTVTLAAGATADVSLAFAGWQPGPDLPTGLGNAVAASDGTKIYVVGGIVSKQGKLNGAFTSGAATDSVLMLDTSLPSPTWQRLPDLPVAREGGAVAISSGRLYVMGGSDGGSDYNDALALDLATPIGWTGLDGPAPLNSACSDGRCAQARTPIGAFDDKGGVALLWTVFDDIPRPPYAVGHVHRFDPKDGKWTLDPPELPAMRTPRRWTAVAALNSLAIVAGGDRQAVIEGDASPGRPTYSLPTVEAFDLESRKWATWPDMPTGRSECAAAGASGSFYVAGGVDQLNAPLDVVERFDLAKKTWLPAPALREPRSSFPLVFAGGKLWAIGGSPSRGVQKNTFVSYSGITLQTVETLAVGGTP